MDFTCTEASIRIPHLGRSTSVGQRCAHANEIRRRRAATSEASPSAGSEQLNAALAESFRGRDYSDPRSPEVRERPDIPFVSSRTFQCSVVPVPRVFCCMLRPRTCVASCVWRLCRVAHGLSRTMLRTCCCLSAARCSPHTKCGDAVCFLVASRMCSRPLACRLLSD